MELELQVAARDLVEPARLADEREGAAVPEHHAARAVIAGGDVALEVAVLEGVVFHVGGEVFERGVERGPFGHGPGFQHAIDLQAKVVMQAGSVVALHAEVVACGLRRAGSGSRFRRLLEAAFGGVLLARHGSSTW